MMLFAKYTTILKKYKQDQLNSCDIRIKTRILFRWNSRYQGYKSLNHENDIIRTLHNAISTVWITIPER